MSKSSIKELAASDLTVDPEVQRQLDPRRVNKIAADWNDLMVGVLTISHRRKLVMPGAPGDVEEADTFVVLDGQTRLEAFRTVCGNPQTTGRLWCEVHTGLTKKEEASIFLQHNDRKAVKPVDRFRISLVAEEQWAVEIGAISQRFGWAPHGIPVQGKIRRFSAITAVEKIYRLDDGVALRRTFETLDNTWNGDPGSVTSETLYGLGLLFARHPEITPKQAFGLVSKLRKMRVGAYTGDIISDHRRYGMSVPRAAYEYTVKLYNRGRSEGFRL